jgi:hypothetical protein
MPNSSELDSPESAFAGVCPGNSEQGHDDVTVVKDHENGAVIAAPCVEVAAEMVAVYVVAAVSGDDGVNVTLEVAALYDVEPEIADPPDGVTDITMLPDWRGNEKAAVTVEKTATPVAPLAGVALDTVGAVVEGAYTGVTQ